MPLQTVSSVFATSCKKIIRSIKVNLSVFTLRTANRSTLTTITSAVEDMSQTNVHDTLKVKVKCTLVQALMLCTGRTAHRGSRGIALLFHDQRH